MLGASELGGWTLESWEETAWTSDPAPGKCCLGETVRMGEKPLSSSDPEITAETSTWTDTIYITSVSQFILVCS